MLKVNCEPLLSASLPYAQVHLCDNLTLHTGTLTSEQPRHQKMGAHTSHHNQEQFTCLQLASPANH